MVTKATRPFAAKRPLVAVVAALVLAVFALAACGDDEESTPTTAAEETTSSTAASGGSAIAVEADPSGALAFTENELTGEAGSDTIEFDNQSSTPHNVYVEDADGNVVAETDTVTGDSAEASADLEAGTYTFYCDVDGHREAGMEGTLTVK